MWALQPGEEPSLAAAVVAAFRSPELAPRCPHSCFVSSCRWSPDGTSVLSCSDDNVLRVFPLASGVAATALGGTAPGGELAPSQAIEQGEAIYDADWYPAASALEPATLCFASTSRGHPVQLWDVASGLARTTYRTYNAVDEVTAAYCLRFHPDCARHVRRRPASTSPLRR